MAKSFALCSVLVLLEVATSLCFVHLRLGGGQPLRLPSPAPEPNGPLEGSGRFEEEEHYHPKQLQTYNQNAPKRCPRVQSFITAESGQRCPRGWANAPECDKPDGRNLGRCTWTDKAEFELPNTRAKLRGVLCKGKRMACLSQAGVISANAQLLYVPRNTLSDEWELADTMYHLRKIIAVDFARNNFEYLKESTFHSCRCLRSVNFDQNFLLDLPEKLFWENGVLTSVSMMGNKLDYLPPRIFQRNRRLTIINFEKNNITKLAPEIFSRNHRLEVIRLDGNSIPNIPPGLFSANPLLREIGLAHNRISVVPKMLFRNTKNLQEVSLSGNIIRKVPGTLFYNCLELRTIKLDRNMLTTLPAKLFERNSKLSHVDLSYNRLHTVNPKLFSNNPSVAVVNEAWKDHQGVLEEEHEDGKWRSSKPEVPQSSYRKTALLGA